MSNPTPDGIEQAAPRSDEIRARLVKLYDEFKPTFTAYHQYAESAQALSVEFIKAVLDERFPDVEKHEALLVATLDAAESPKTTERRIAELHSRLAASGTSLTRIEHDLNTGKFYIYA